MEKLAKVLLAIIGFAMPVLFILYLFIPSIRPKNEESAAWLGVGLFFATLFGLRLLYVLAGFAEAKTRKKTRK